MTKPKLAEIVPGLFLIRDTCNVYVLRGRSSFLAIDFGSGRWFKTFKSLGLPPLSHVLITHHHADQCAGLAQRAHWPFQILAPIREEPFMLRKGVAAFWKRRRMRSGMPESYSVMASGLSTSAIEFSMKGFSDLFWEGRRVRFIHTPGHGRHALSVLIDHAGRQLLFCGDAAHAGATLWEPYHLEWDHWTGSGTLAAWEGLQRLSHLRIDLLCPAHGPVVRRSPARMLQRLSKKMLRLYEAKGSVISGEPDHYVTPLRFLRAGREVVAGLYQFGLNAYLLLSRTGQGFVVDMQEKELGLLQELRRKLDRPKITAATATHYHSDHVSGLPVLRGNFGALIWMHPCVARPLARGRPLDVPYLVPTPIRPDRLWPESGMWRWNEFTFRVAPFPGQTWWHCCFMTQIDGRKVFFGGDNFQPASRWNGTGGFCAINGSQFRKGFISSARRVLAWRPDLLVCGHGTYYSFHATQFRKIIRWSRKAEEALKALCPNGNMKRHYYHLSP